MHHEAEIQAARQIQCGVRRRGLRSTGHVTRSVALAISGALSLLGIEGRVRNDHAASPKLPRHAF